MKFCSHIQFLQANAIDQMRSYQINLAYHGVGIESLHDEEATPPPKPSPTQACDYGT